MARKLNLTAQGCRARRQRLASSLAAGPELQIVADPQFQSSLANYYASPFSFRSSNASALLLVEPDGSGALVVDGNSRPFADDAHVERVVEGPWYDGQRTAAPRRDRLVEIALQTLADRRLEHIGVDASCAPFGLIEALQRRSQGLRISDIGPDLHRLKRRKDDDELALIEASVRAAEAGLQAARDKVRPGLSEQDVYRLVADAAQRELGQPALVYGDFVSGPRCEAGGGPPSDRAIERGDLVLLDFSVVVRGYRGDLAATFRCGAPPTPEQERLATACHAALAAGEALLAPGRPAREVDSAVRAALAVHHLERHFRSHSGHGLGLGHPDPPYLVRDSVDVLAERDVVALEPGVYIPGVAGMRFEHNYVITADGCRRLSGHRTDLQQA